jgi:hypothetical protein
MSDLTIECPNCGNPIELTEALAGPMLEAERRKAMVETERRLAFDAKAMVEEATNKARAESEGAIAELKRQKKTGEAELAKARQAEMAALKAKQEADDAKRSVDIEVARRAAEQTVAARKDIAKQYADELEAERRLAAAAKATIEDALKKARGEHEAAIAELKRQQKSREAEMDQARAAEVAARQAKQEADAAKRSVEVEVARRVAEQTAAAADQAREEAAKQYAAEVESARSRIAATDGKLAEAQAAELDARRAKHEAEEAKREAELLVERRLDEERNKVRGQALKERDDEYRLKMQEKERQLSDLKEKLAEAQRKADLGSSQLRGDVLEVDLCDTLSSAFPGDTFERVKKGQKGGDVVHTVRNSSGLVCGKIKWESKFTQKWSNTWLPKLREDQRAFKCDLAALMTDVLPDDVKHFTLIDGVWVSGIPAAVPMAAALRSGLIAVATARRAAAGADSSKDQVYRYLTGPEFRARVQGAVEPVLQMRTSLDSEKRAAERQFAVRDKQIQRVVMSLAGMYGDLQGLVGPSLPTVQGLALPAPDAETQTNMLLVGEGEAPGDPEALCA